MPGAAPAAAEADAPRRAAPGAAAPDAAGPLDAAAFAACMAPLGPFGATPRLAAGVSGGPHSLALALLAADWARARGGSLLALVADHGLRAESAAEADGVAARLAGRGIAVRVLCLTGLAEGGGAAVQARAREARLAALLAACREAGRPWLLLGHHRADQAETLLLRALAGSGAAGLAAMAPLRAAPEALILRPLLGVAPARLEAVLRQAGNLAPVRDPSNADPRFTRVRLRGALADPDGAGPAVGALAAAAAAFGRRRMAEAEALATRLAAAGARLWPEGWASLDPDLLGQDALGDAALAALIRAVGGAAHAPGRAAVAALRARATGGTLAGAWLAPGGGRTWRLVRAPAARGEALAPPVAAVRGAIWDGRFRMAGPGEPGCRVEALGAEAAAGLRRRGGMAGPIPAAALAALPAIRRDRALVAVPGLLYPDRPTAGRFTMLFAPGAGPVAAGAGEASGCAGQPFHGGGATLSIGYPGR